MFMGWSGTARSWDPARTPNPPGLRLERGACVLESCGAVAAAMSERSGEIVRVMIVEDDPAMLERFAAALVRDPRTRVVEKVRSGKEAIARLPLVTPDVLLVDLGLPDVHGTEVIRFAARNLPVCDIMVITVFGDERNVIASI